MLLAATDRLTMVCELLPPDQLVPLRWRQCPAFRRTLDRTPPAATSREGESVSTAASAVCDQCRGYRGKVYVLIKCATPCRAPGGRPMGAHAGPCCGAAELQEPHQATSPTCAAAFRRSFCLLQPTGSDCTTSGAPSFLDRHNWWSGQNDRRGAGQTSLQGTLYHARRQTAAGLPGEPATAAATQQRRRAEAAAWRNAGA